MKTIETKYHGPGNVRGSRYSATDCGDHKVFVSTDHALNSDENHKAAATALRDKLGWKEQMIGGNTKAGMVWVFVGAGSPVIDGRE